MKAFTLFIICFCFYSISSGQSFAIIKDKDGFVNVRKDRNVHSLVVGKLYNNDIFGVDEEDGSKSDWVKIYRQTNDKMSIGLEGYIRRSRIVFLSEFKVVKNIKLYPDSCVAADDNITVIVKSARFNPKKHILSFNHDSDNHQSHNELSKIDGKQIFGTDGETPKRKISELKLIKNGNKLIIPEKAYADLYEPRFKSLEVFVSDQNTFYIEMDNSDGAGSYTVIWIIKGGRYVKRYIDNSND